jgi:small-conductance mechanosensitive channel
MDEDNLNIEIRKFLKQVGISSQREIENYIRKKFTEEKIKIGETIKVSMKLSSEDGELNHSIEEELKIK